MRDGYADVVDDAANVSTIDRPWKWRRENFFDTKFDKVIGLEQHWKSGREVGKMRYWYGR